MSTTNTISNTDATVTTNDQNDLDTIRIDIDILDKLMALAGELVLVRNQRMQRLENADINTRNIAKRLDLVTNELQESIMRTRMHPVGNLFKKYPRVVEDFARDFNKQIEITTSGDSVELDRTILESIFDPLAAIVRNCCRHGIESPTQREELGKPVAGKIRLSAHHEGGQILIHICDDGKGFDSQKIKDQALSQGLKTTDELAKMGEQEALNLVFLPGFARQSTSGGKKALANGLHAVKNKVEEYGGSIEINPAIQSGSDISLRLPLTLAIIPCLIVTVAEQRFSLPQVNIEEIVCLYDDDIVKKIECAGHREVYRLRNTLLPLVRLGEVLARPEPFTENVKSEITDKYKNQGRKIDDKNDKLAHALNFVVLKIGKNRFGLIVDSVIGTEEVVVTAMHTSLKNLPIYTGAAVMGDGEVSLIVDIFGVARHAGINFAKQNDAIANQNANRSNLQNNDQESLILFRYGPQEQFAVDISKIRRIEMIKMTNVEKVGNKSFITLDNRSTSLVFLDQILNVSKPEIQEEMFFLLSKDEQNPFGLIVSSLEDIGEYTFKLDTETHQDKGLEGTAIIKNRMTLLVNMEELTRYTTEEVIEEDQALEPLKQAS